MNERTRRMLYSGATDNMVDMRGRQPRDGQGRWMNNGGQMSMIGYGEQDGSNYRNRAMNMNAYNGGYDTYGGGNYGAMDGYEMNGRGRMMMGSSQAGQMMQMGSANIEEYLESPITIGEAMHWAECLPNGPHWKTDEVKKYAQQVGIKTEGVDFAEFYAMMNAKYSDYCKVMKKYGFDRPEIYAELAKADIEDEDAVPNKSAIYYRFIVNCE